MTETTKPPTAQVPTPRPSVEDCCEADLIRCLSGCGFTVAAPADVAGSALEAYQALLQHMLERYALTEQQVYLEVRDAVFTDRRTE